MRAPCTNRVRLAFLSLALLVWHSHSACAEEKSLTNDVRDVLLRGVHKGDRSKAEQLSSYAKRTGNSMEHIENALIEFLPMGLKDISVREHRTNYLLCSSAIWVLRDMRCARAIPYLKGILEVTTDGNMRHAAVMARVAIGGKDLLPYAREVFCNRKRYCAHARFLLYEQLSPYVGVDAVRPVPLEGAALPPEYDTLHRLVLQFMRNAVYEDITAAGNTRRLDKILCIADDRYKVSSERESVLERLEEAWEEIGNGKGSSSARAYPTEQLKALRAIPADKRTHIEVTTIGAVTTPRTEQDFILSAKHLASVSAKCTDIIARCPAILEHAQVLPSNAPVISVRFDYFEPRSGNNQADGSFMEKGGSIIVDMLGDGRLESISVETFAFPLK